MTALEQDNKRFVVQQKLDAEAFSRVEAELLNTRSKSSSSDVLAEQLKSDLETVLSTKDLMIAQLKSKDDEIYDLKWDFNKKIESLQQNAAPSTSNTPESERITTLETEIQSLQDTILDLHANLNSAKTSLINEQIKKVEANQPAIPESLKLKYEKMIENLSTKLKETEALVTKLKKELVEQQAKSDQEKQALGLKSEQLSRDVQEKDFHNRVKDTKIEELISEINALKPKEESKSEDPLPLQISETQQNIKKMVNVLQKSQKVSEAKEIQIQDMEKKIRLFRET